MTLIIEIILAVWLWITVGYMGWKLTINNTENKEWPEKIKDPYFKTEAMIMHLIFAPISLINGIFHTI